VTRWGAASSTSIVARANDRVALLAGADDARYVAIARALPAPLSVIDDSGHDPLLEQPQALTATLAQLLG
jgi:pimeloyl-ACP methyl ester carboxylesterase